MFKIFITNLGKYNEGELVGKWLDLPCDDLTAELESIGVIEGSMYEEYFITDYENDYGYQVGEYESLSELNELADRLEDLDSYDSEKLRVLLEEHEDDLETALDHLDDCTWYSGQDVEDIAREIVEDCYNLSEFALRYFDYEAFARDLKLEGHYIETLSGTLQIDY